MNSNRSGRPEEMLQRKETGIEENEKERDGETALHVDAARDASSPTTRRIQTRRKYSFAVQL